MSMETSSMIVHSSSQSISESSPDVTPSPTYHRRTNSCIVSPTNGNKKPNTEGVMFDNKHTRSNSFLESIGSKSFLTGFNSAKSTIQPIGRHITSMASRSRPKSMASADDILSETIQTLKEKCFILTESLDVKSQYASKLENSLKKTEQKLSEAKQEVSRIQDQKDLLEKEWALTKNVTAQDKYQIMQEVQEHLDVKEAEIKHLNLTLVEVKNSLTSLINNYRGQLTEATTELNETKEIVRNQMNLLKNHHQLQHHLELKTSEIFRLKGQVAQLNNKHQTDIKVIEEQSNLLMDQLRTLSHSKEHEISKLKNTHSKSIEQLNGQFKKDLLVQEQTVSGLNKKIQSLEEEIVILKAKTETSFSPESLPGTESDLSVNEPEEEQEESHKLSAFNDQESSKTLLNTEDLSDVPSSSKQSIYEMNMSHQTIGNLKEVHHNDITEQNLAIEQQFEEKYQGLITDFQKEIELKEVNEATLLAKINTLTIELEAQKAVNEYHRAQDFETLQKKYSEAISQAEILNHQLSSYKSASAKQSEVLIREKDRISRQFDQLQAKNMTLLREKGDLAQELAEIQAASTRH